VEDFLISVGEAGASEFVIRGAGLLRGCFAEEEIDVESAKIPGERILGEEERGAAEGVAMESCSRESESASSLFIDGGTAGFVVVVVGLGRPTDSFSDLY
jgi:hypothetical protein